MGQIVGGAAKPKRCNLNKLSQLSTPAAGEYILVSSDNSMNAAGQGNFDSYIEGDGTKAATALELKYLDADLRTEVYGTGTQVNLSSYPSVMFTINASGVWATTTNDNHSIFVPMQDGKYTLTASSSAPALYTVLTSNDTPTAGATPAYATGYSNRISIPAGGTVTVQGTSGLYLWMRNDTSTSGAMAPTVIYSGEQSRIDIMENDVAELNDKWVISPKTVNYVEGHYYNSKGVVKDNVSYGYTEEYIPILPNTSYSFNSGITNSTAYLCEYGSDKVYKANRQLNAVPRTFTTNSTSYFLRVSFPLSQVENIWLKDSLGNILWQAITPANIGNAAVFDSRITPLEDVLTETEVEARVLKAYTSKYYIMANSENADYGNAVYYNNADYACTPFIDISGYNKFSVATLTSTSKAGAGTVVYDADKVPIAGYYKVLSPSTYTVEGTLPENAAYIRISCWSWLFSSGDVVLHLWDTLKDFTIRKTADLESRVSDLEATGVPAGATMYDYQGEKIVIDLPKYTGSGVLTMSLTGTGQGGTAFGDYYFVGTGGNAYINVFNLSTRAKLAAIVPDSTPNSRTHDNTMCFSNQYYDESDQFPILYISSGYTDDQGSAQAYGYRITNTNDTWAATLVHTITLTSSGSWIEFLIDNIRQKAWIASGGNWYCVDMPQYADGDAEIDISSLTSEFQWPLYSGSGQGQLFYNDKIYFPTGTASQSAKNLYVLNTKTGKYDSIVDLHSVSGNDEPENVFIYDGYLHIGYRTNVIRLYFN